MTYLPTYNSNEADFEANTCCITTWQLFLQEDTCYTIPNP